MLILLVAGLELVVCEKWSCNQIWNKAGTKKASLNGNSISFDFRAAFVSDGFGLQLMSDNRAFSLPSHVIGSGSFDSE